MVGFLSRMGVLVVAGEGMGICLLTSVGAGVESLAFGTSSSSTSPRRCWISASSTPLDLKKSTLMCRGAVLTASSSRKRRATCSLSAWASSCCCDCDCDCDCASSALGSSSGAVSCHLGTPSGDGLSSESSILFWVSFCRNWMVLSHIISWKGDFD